MDYITYEDFIEYVKTLEIPDSVEVTVPWCEKRKLNVDPSEIRSWGVRFHKDCAKYGFIVEEREKKANYTYYKVRKSKR